ncbi:hypothetical protein GCM10027294_44280 [Marinactinospora endophytica]
MTWTPAADVRAPFRLAARHLANGAVDHRPVPGPVRPRKGLRGSGAVPWVSEMEARGRAGEVPATAPPRGQVSTAAPSSGSVGVRGGADPTSRPLRVPVRGGGA